MQDERQHESRGQHGRQGVTGETGRAWRLYLVTGCLLALFGAVLLGILLDTRIVTLLSLVLMPTLLLECDRALGAPRRKRWERMQRAMEYPLNAVGWLAAELPCVNRHTRAETCAELIRLLFQMRPEHGRLLDAQQRSYLYTELTEVSLGREAELQLAILAALEQVGDSEAIPHVRVVSTSIAPSRRARQVRAAATRCLGVLEERAKEEEAMRSLLRASDAPHQGTLLRAAVHSPAEEAEQLVRPW